MKPSDQDVLTHRSLADTLPHRVRFPLSLRRLHRSQLEKLSSPTPIQLFSTTRGPLSRPCWYPLTPSIRDQPRMVLLPYVPAWARPRRQAGCGSGIGRSGGPPIRTTVTRKSTRFMCSKQPIQEREGGRKNEAGRGGERRGGQRGGGGGGGPLSSAVCGSVDVARCRQPKHRIIKSDHFLGWCRRSTAPLEKHGQQQAEGTDIFLSTGHGYKKKWCPQAAATSNCYSIKRATLNIKLLFNQTSHAQHQRAAHPPFCKLLAAP